MYQKSFTEQSFACGIGVALLNITDNLTASVEIISLDRTKSYILKRKTKNSPDGLKKPSTWRSWVLHSHISIIKQQVVLKLLFYSTFQNTFQCDLPQYLIRFAQLIAKGVTFEMVNLCTKERLENWYIRSVLIKQRSHTVKMLSKLMTSRKLDNPKIKTNLTMPHDVNRKRKIVCNHSENFYFRICGQTFISEISHSEQSKSVGNKVVNPFEIFSCLCKYTGLIYLLK